jgi:hypothetical protein
MAVILWFGRHVTIPPLVPGSIPTTAEIFIIKIKLDFFETQLIFSLLVHNKPGLFQL